MKRFFKLFLLFLLILQSLNFLVNCSDRKDQQGEKGNISTEIGNGLKTVPARIKYSALICKGNDCKEENIIDCEDEIVIQSDKNNDGSLKLTSVSYYSPIIESVEDQIKFDIEFMHNENNMRLTYYDYSEVIEAYSQGGETSGSGYDMSTPDFNLKREFNNIFSMDNGNSRIEYDGNTITSLVITLYNVTLNESKDGSTNYIVFDKFEINTL